MKLTEKKLVLLGLTLSIPILLYSAPITIPVTFADGNVLTAAQLNQNFTAILNKINELDAAITSLSDRVNGSMENNPDISNGEPVFINFNKDNPYTVPNSKALFVLYSSKSIVDREMGTNVYGSIITGDKIYEYNGYGSPIITQGIKLYIDSSSSATQGFISGYLINHSDNLVFIKITQLAPYIVPNGKSFILTHSTTALYVKHSFISRSLLYQPKESRRLILTQGIDISCSDIAGSSCTGYISGYLK